MKFFVKATGAYIPQDNPNNKQVVAFQYADTINGASALDTLTILEQHIKERFGSIATIFDANVRFVEYPGCLTPKGSRIDD